MEESNTTESLYCPDCGSAMAADDRFCSCCRWDAERPTEHAKRPPSPSPRNLGTPSNKNRLTTLVLCLVGGYLGVHRFYAGRIGSGVLWLVTFGLFGVGWIYDIVMIATGEFVDHEAKRILYWE
jgi:hypothetical protein